MLPKRIWFLWLQGIDDAPLLVRRCLDSWRHWNPDWQIEVLDQARVATLLPEFCDWRSRWPGMTPTALSDMIRLKLLKSSGGVWVDATCLCRKPLDTWITFLARRGFFAFANPGPDRRIASWFLAAAPENSLVAAWNEEIDNYWESHRGRALAHTPEQLRLPEFNAYRADPMLWFDPTRPEFSAVYPYFWVHYLFSKMLQNPEIAALWDAVPKITADLPHRLQHLGLGRAVDQQFEREFRHGLAPFYKLNYRLAVDIDDRSLVLGYVLASSNW